MKNLLNKNMGKSKLEDIIDDNTEILFCGMAVGDLSCEWKHYYANSSNRFWKVLYEAGILEVLIEPSRDEEIRKSNYDILKKNNIGLTDLVKNQCGIDREIIAKETDIERLRKIIVSRKNLQTLIFNGKNTASKFFKKTSRNLAFGRQEEKSKELGLGIYVLPSTSGINTRYNTKKIAKILKSFVKI